MFLIILNFKTYFIAAFNYFFFITKNSYINDLKNKKLLRQLKYTRRVKGPLFFAKRKLKNYEKITEEQLW